VPSRRLPDNGGAAAAITLACAADELARARARAVARDLRRAGAGQAVDVLVVAAAGSDDLAAACEQVREALRDGRADAAVLGWDALPPGPRDGLVLGAVPMRADPRDALVSPAGRVMAYLAEGARVACLERRQAAQVLRRRTDLRAFTVGGDPVAAMDRLDAGEADALVARACDLDWLERSDRVAEFFDTDQMIPAPGQGALALEVREGDARALRAVAVVHDPDTAYAVAAERACMLRLGASASSPVGVFALTDGETMFIHGMAITDDGSRAARLRWTGPTRAPEEVGDTLGELLESVGARDILAGGPLPPSIRYAERRRQLISDLDGED